MIGMVGLINAILGVGLLLAGRKLFWLFVGAAGFVLGAQIVIRSFHGPEWLGLVIGIVVGLLFAGLAVFLRAAAIGIAGFIAGASILVSLVELFRINVGGMAWLVYLVGGVIGIILVSLLFNWALITLSSLGGAALIVRELMDAGVLQTALASVVFFVLVILGVVIQGTALRREGRHA
ncbi:MAG TPA: hypothetical protein VIV15_15020 [Anaerolineales bacterium]